MTAEGKNKQTNKQTPAAATTTSLQTGARDIGMLANKQAFFKDAGLCSDDGEGWEGVIKLGPVTLKNRGYSRRQTQRGWAELKGQRLIPQNHTIMSDSESNR